MLTPTSGTCDTRGSNILLLKLSGTILSLLVLLLSLLVVLVVVSLLLPGVDDGSRLLFCESS